MSFFNRRLAVEYALKWALGRNPDFPDYSAQGSGGDCTNFISQAMLAGGWPMVWGGGDDYLAWWTGEVNSSRTWAAAENFRQFLKRTARASPCQPHQLVPGDLAFIVHSDSAKHLMMVTHMAIYPSADRHDANADMKALSFSYHSNDRRNIPLKLVWTNAGSENLEYWKVADLVPGAREPLTLVGMSKKAAAVKKARR